MTFDGIKKYFKEELEWKFNKNIKEDKFIKMCEDALFTIDKMKRLLHLLTFTPSHI